jgi:hypothetical protein
MIQTGGGTESLGGFDAEIIAPWREFRIIAGQGNPMTIPMADLDRISKADGHHECLQFMETVRSLPEDSERKVDLGRSRE